MLIAEVLAEDVAEAFDVGRLVNVKLVWFDRPLHHVFTEPPGTRTEQVALAVAHRIATGAGAWDMAGD